MSVDSSSRLCYLSQPAPLFSQDLVVLRFDGVGIRVDAVLRLAFETKDKNL